MIPIAQPTMGEDEKRAVWEVLESGHLAQGGKVQEFENRFAHYCGVKCAIATSSGTTALWTALLAHGIGPGDLVITSPFTFIASANAMLYVGARPVFVDIEPETFNIDPNLVEARVKKLRAENAPLKAILPVHLYGHPCDMDALTAIARRYQLVVVEDACQAHGASIGGRKVGTFGTGCFSFYPTKNITTAEGGIVTTDDLEIAERARMLRNHGSRRRYFHEILGYNFRMTDLQAAIGLAQIDRLPDWTRHRIENAEYLSRHLVETTSIAVPTVKPGCVHVFHQYTVRVRHGRDEAVEKLAQRGVGTGVHYPIPVHHQPLYLDLGYADSLPVSEQASREVLSLPVHPALTRDHLDTVIEAVKEL